MTHLLLQPLLLLLNLLLQGLAELLHLLLVLGHAPARDGTAREVVRPCCSGCRFLGPALPVGSAGCSQVCPEGFTQQGCVQQSESGTFAIPCVTVEGAQPQTSAGSQTSSPATDGGAESTQVSPSLGASPGWGEQRAPPRPHPIPLHRTGVTHLFRVTSKASFLLLAS